LLELSYHLHAKRCRRFLLLPSLHDRLFSHHSSDLGSVGGNSACVHHDINVLLTMYWQVSRALDCAVSLPQRISILSVIYIGILFAEEGQRPFAAGRRRVFEEVFVCRCTFVVLVEIIQAEETRTTHLLDVNFKSIEEVVVKITVPSGAGVNGHRIYAPWNDGRALRGCDLFEADY
jgi:hypothetical protein